MSFWSRLKQKTVVSIRRALSIESSDGWGQSLENDSGETVTEARVLGLSPSWACVNLIAGTTGTLPLLTYQKKNGEVAKVVDGHWSQRLLNESPNTDDTNVDFWEFVAASLELRGRAYARKYMSPNGDRVVSLVPIHADHVTPVRIRSGMPTPASSRPDSFQIRNDDGSITTIPKKEMFFIKGFLGISTLAAARHAMGIAVGLDKSAGATFRNGPKAWGVLKFDKFLKPEQRKLTREVLEREHQGASSTGKPLILEGGADWQQISFSPNDAQMIESRKFSVEEQCRFFQVPPVLVGHSGTTVLGSSINQIIRGFVTFTMRRRLKRIEAAIHKQILQPKDRAEGIYVKFSLDGLLRGDSAERANFYKIMTGFGGMTINEVRALEDLSPVEGGDVPRLQKQYVAITDIDALEAASNNGESGNA